MGAMSGQCSSASNSPPPPTFASTSLASVIMTASQSVERWIILTASAISSLLCSPFLKCGRLFSAMARAILIFSPYRLSSTRKIRLKTPINTIMPKEFISIMGRAIFSTSAIAAEYGLATKRMMAICPISATAVSKNSSPPPISPDLNLRENAAPMAPSIMVDRAQLTAVKPPMSKRYRWIPPIRAAPTPTYGPPKSPAAITPMTRVLTIAP